MSLSNFCCTVECDCCGETVEIEMAELAGGDGGAVDSEDMAEQAPGWVWDGDQAWCPRRPCQAQREEFE